VRDYGSLANLRKSLRESARSALDRKKIDEVKLHAMLERFQADQVRDSVAAMRDGTIGEGAETVR
jgi:hypothetical protein